MNEALDTSETASAGDYLSPVQIRVLAALAEKEALTPDNYPLSLNAVTNACNQLTSREPVMTLSEEEVQDTLQQLMQRKLVAEVNASGARVKKYEHRMRIVWMLEQDKLALLTILMLRGPQTAGEIRNRIGRLHEFASVSEVETGLQFLMDKYPPLVVRLSRLPGSKEARYAQVLGGEPALDAAPLPTAREEGGGANASLEQEVAQLRMQVEQLSRQFEEFKRQFD